MKYSAHYLFILIIALFATFHGVKANEISGVESVPGKYGHDYYHLKYTLTPQNTNFPSGSDKYGARTFQIGGGQFEVFIAKDKFPIETSASQIILRMPANQDPVCEDLGKRIETMLKSGQGSVDVVIELNPYVEKISDHPLRLRLTAANVFFRTANGKCITHLGPIDSKHLIKKGGKSMEIQTVASDDLRAAHPGIIIFRQMWNKTEHVEQATNVPQSNQFVYYNASGHETSDIAYAVRRVPIVEVELSSFDAGGNLVEPTKATRVEITEYGPQHQFLRHTSRQNAS